MTIDRKHMVKLRQILSMSLNESELRTLCFDLAVEYDHLPGNSLLDKARELVAYFEKRNKINDLIRMGQELRPDIDWMQQTGEQNDLTMKSSLVKSQVSVHNLSVEAQFWHWFELKADQLMNFEDYNGPRKLDHMVRY